MMSMLEQLNPQSMVDIGFVVLVTIACARSMWGSSDAAEKNRQLLRMELQSLEETLRSLISEAGSASTRLDRSLLQRKQELEKLLEKLDGKEQKKIAQTGNKRPVRESSLTLDNDDDLPNESWKTPLPQLNGSVSTSEKTRLSQTKQSDIADDFVLGSGLEQLVRQTDDSVSISAKAAQGKKNRTIRAAASIPVRNAATAPRTLREEIQLVRSDPTENKAFARTSIVDPTTYRIARRLLLEGKELHVVARKLELPLSEIRELDRLLRHEQGSAGAAEGGESIISNHSPRFTELKTEQEIQREVALL